MGDSTVAVSVDHQKLVISGFLKNSYILSVVEKDLNDGYFSDSSCRIIYKSLISYYHQYQSLPSELSLYSAIDDNFIELGPSKEAVKSVARSLLMSDDIDETFLLDKVKELVKKVRVSRAFSRSLDRIKSGVSLNDEELVNELIASLEVNYNKSGVFILSDARAIDEERRLAIGDSKRSGIIKSVIPTVNMSLQYNGYQKGTINLIVSPPGVGKTSFLVNEGAYAAIQGFNVLHVFLGDMVGYDGMVRYISNISGINQDEIIKMDSIEQDELIVSVNKDHTRVLDRIAIVSYGASAVTVDELIEFIKNEQEHLEMQFDDIIIDYADNFKKDNTNLYSEGGYIYDRLALLARMNNSVVMVASQPKIGHWNSEIIPMEGASESSKKQHVVDVLMTFNTVARAVNIGSIFIPKVRRGFSGKIARVETHWENCRIQEIDETEYNLKRGQLNL